MDSRAKFLSDESHRIRFVYTPKHASWLNQVEIWFGVLTNKLLKRLSSKSTDELKEKILSFVTYFKALTADPTSLRSAACPRSLKSASELDPANKSRDVVVGAAVKPEKQIKKWNRQWKINLIEQHNPQWLDFSIGLC